MGKKEKLAEFYQQKRARVRDHETIGGGFVVFAIDPESGRILPPPVPFEHDKRTEAIAACVRLQEANPERKFAVYANILWDDDTTF